jgi:hypothetical protein
LAQAIDALREDKVSPRSVGMEILVRRLAGVLQADLYGKPDLIDLLRWNPPNMLLATDVMRALLKDAKKNQAVYSASSSRGVAAKSKSSSSSSSASASKVKRGAAK